MERETKYTGILGGLQRLLGVTDPNRRELPQREPFRLELAGLLAQALEDPRARRAACLLPGDEAGAGGARSPRSAAPPSPTDSSRPIGSSSRREARSSCSPFFCPLALDSAPSSPDNGPSYAPHSCRTRRISIVRSAFPSSPDNGPSYAAHFRRTRRIFIVSIRRSVVRGAFPLYAAHFRRLQTTDRRTQRISVVHGAFSSSPYDAPSYAAHFCCTQRISIVSRRWPVVRGAFSSSADDGPLSSEDSCPPGGRAVVD
jgi:hypothetical protein